MGLQVVSYEDKRENHEGTIYYIRDVETNLSCRGKNMKEFNLNKNNELICNNCYNKEDKTKVIDEVTEINNGYKLVLKCLKCETNKNIIYERG